MPIALKYGLVFAGGVTAGLLFAKWYAHAKAESGLHSALDRVGLGGGYIENFAGRIILPEVA